MSFLDKIENEYEIEFKIEVGLRLIYDEYLLRFYVYDDLLKINNLMSLYKIQWKQREMLHFLLN